MQSKWETSWFAGQNAAYLEQLYEDYLTGDSNLSKGFKAVFESLQSVKATEKDVLHSKVKQEFIEFAKHKTRFPSTGPESPKAFIEKQMRVFSLITEYRLLGHRQASLDPLGLCQTPDIPQLTLAYHQLTPTDLNHSFRIDQFEQAKSKTLSQIYQDLNKIYCGTVASECMHISDPAERTWIRDKIEKILLERRMAQQQQVCILEQLIAAEGLEKYLANQYPGAKRFGLEGGESFMVALHELIRRSGQYGTKEVVIGMAHRGRLNVLVNIFGKMPGDLFDEFEGTQDIDLTLGDVKYHQGFSSNIATPNGNMHLALAFNPSHLESVTPVVCGSVRARNERREDSTFLEVLPVLVHGDAAFAGQGIVMETLNMSQTRGFTVGGSIHVIINNQVGFTTSDPQDARSTVYCSDVAKMLQAPIFHVNGDDPEAVYWVSQIALDYRSEYKKDVVIDLVCYRRHGHNEADEPWVTQPKMYAKIQQKKSTLQNYANKLIQEKVVSQTKVDQKITDYRKKLEERKQSVVEHLVKDWSHEFEFDWNPHFGQDWQETVNTAMPLKTLKALATKRDAVPEHIELHPRVKKIIDDRKKMTAGALPLDWGFAETLAYASLLVEGIRIRLSGQDSARGTFFHRHAVLHDQKTGHEYTPLSFLDPKQAVFSVVNSLLSELAVLGFEYGYATTAPNTLVIWEAQFGDFANGAQILIDQFISSGEHKWGRLCGLTLLLPHGYEGQGPEHSSARLERYLQLCAKYNMQICVPTTSAQIFHLLRKQMLQAMRKPLIVFTPKSLLRHKQAASMWSDLTSGGFQPILVDLNSGKPATISRIILCSGKIYYDLLDKKEKESLHQIVLIRIEQLYPFPEKKLRTLLKTYSKASEVVWVQEEPRNQGAWYSSRHHFVSCLASHQTLYFVGREASSAPSVGYASLHFQQQAALVDQALCQSVLKEA